MKIKFHNPKELDRNLKVSIHKSGKMGFTVEAANKLKLATGKSAAIGTNEENPEDDSLFILMYNEVKDEAFRVSKAGDYFYINTKPLFDTLKIDYSQGNLAYDLSVEKINGEDIFVLRKRKIKEKNRGESVGEN